MAVVAGPANAPHAAGTHQPDNCSNYPFLESHEEIERIIFPFHPSFDQYELAKKQMKAALGLVTIVIKNRKRAAIVKFCESLRHFLMAVSWGGHESLVIPRCAFVKEDVYQEDNESHRHVRLYFGLEDADYLIKDLQQALLQSARI
nr:PLP-dependent transferase [Niabella hibiscisoli]